MMSHYRNTNSIAYLLLCLFITSATAQSFIRQFTEDLNTNQQQEVGAGPIQDLDVAHHYLQENQEISSRDYKVSSSNTVNGLTMFPPSSYEIKIDYVTRLLNLTYAEKYVSRPFAVGGYNWTLIVYPKGNKNDGGLGYLSLYVAIDKSTLITADQEVYAYLRFYIFNNKEGKYFTIQDIDAFKFNAVNTTWGLSQVLSLDAFKDPINGYIYGRDFSMLGVDVIISSLYKESELFSIQENFPNPILNWTIPGFSTLLDQSYLSDVFSIGGRKWYLDLYPYGNARGYGNYLSMYLNINADEISRPYEKIYFLGKFRLLNQRQLDNYEIQIDDWFNEEHTNWGRHQFISLSDLKNSSKGFIVNDVLIVQVEFTYISSTKYFPS